MQMFHKRILSDGLVSYIITHPAAVVKGAVQTLIKCMITDL